ncbi:hypothetical protein ABMA32_01775 [Mesorhizobium sp. VNQ89]|uniref:hypothetical protein n=1 Tax=Mesorhizobium quangtriensis TaxID=3157709 RepID=UPI0032B77C25
MISQTPTIDVRSWIVSFPSGRWIAAPCRQSRWKGKRFILRNPNVRREAHTNAVSCISGLQLRARSCFSAHDPALIEAKEAGKANGAWPLQESVRYLMKEHVKVFERQDGSARVVISVHTVSPRLFSFTEEIWKVDDDHPLGPDAYWSSTYESGLYDTAEAAEVEASSMFPWIASQISN